MSQLVRVARAGQESAETPDGRWFLSCVGTGRARVTGASATGCGRGQRAPCSIFSEFLFRLLLPRSLVS
eukprot:1526222-Pleurochrysis_carterae.AAC.3